MNNFLFVRTWRPSICLSGIWPNAARPKGILISFSELEINKFDVEFLEPPGFNNNLTPNLFW